MESTNGRKTNLIILAVVLALAIAAFVWWSGAKKVTSPSAELSPAELQGAATSVDTGNLDKEFESINKDLNAL